jgi:hypothetical protein
MKKISFSILLLFIFSQLSGLTIPVTNGAETENYVISEADMKSVNESSMASRVNKKDKLVKTEIKKLIKLQAKAVRSKNKIDLAKLSDKLVYIYQKTEVVNGSKISSNKMLKDIASEIINEAGGTDKVIEAVIQSHNTEKALTDNELAAYLAMSLDYEIDSTQVQESQLFFETDRSIGIKSTKQYPKKCENSYFNTTYSSLGTGYKYSSQTKACHDGIKVSEGKGVTDGIERFGWSWFAYIWEGNRLSDGNYSTDKKYYRHNHGGLVSYQINGILTSYFRPQIDTK